DGREFATGTRSTVHEITIGGTYYFYGQNAKFTVDLSYFPDGTPVADPGNDVLANPGHAELVGRAVPVDVVRLGPLQIARGHVDQAITASMTSP
ncbi:MAG TPA: hypothetical protein VLJ39_10265, partial [Tepidisphaeraceae bacterium]|nr:hypothetical protein [Tepidisphaeraceae bacterium]